MVERSGESDQQKAGQKNNEKKSELWYNITARDADRTPA